MSNLPAYIQNRQPSETSLAQRGLALVGTGAGPYLSIEGNRFTLVDSAGNTRPFETLYADVVIIDLNDHVSKMFYDKDWEADNPTPPACFSDNGIAPSVAAACPPDLKLGPTCASCWANVWGSKISKMGSKVKACRDEMKSAIIVPGMPGNMFRLTVPPNSLTNFRAYLAKFQNAGFDLADVVTRLTFEQGVQGTLVFNPAPNPWLDDSTLEVRNKAIASKGADMLVGRLDRPRQGLIAGPGLVETLAKAQQQSHLSGSVQQTEPAPGAQGQLFGGTTSAQPAGQTPAAEPQRRRRRTQAEIAADTAAAGQNAGQPAGIATAPAMAPFRPNPAAGTIAAQPGAFGIQQGVQPNPELAGAIADIFGT